MSDINVHDFDTATYEQDLAEAKSFADNYILGGFFTFETADGGRAHAEYLTILDAWQVGVEARYADS